MGAAIRAGVPAATAAADAEDAMELEAADDVGGGVGDDGGGRRDAGRELRRAWRVAQGARAACMRQWPRGFERTKQHSILQLAAR